MKLLGYSIDLNIIILIGILYLIMVINALSGSCKREGNTNMGEMELDELEDEMEDELELDEDEMEAMDSTYK
jgi:hypothetical protein